MSTKRFTFKYVCRLLVELLVLLAIYLLGCQVALWLAWPIPGGVIGLGLLLLVFASGLIKPAALQLGAGMLMAEMLLFFVPAVVAVVNYAQLLMIEGWKIFLVIGISTMLTLGATAVVVDKVYRLEQRLAARKASRD